MYVTGEVSYGSGSARLTYGSATAVLFVDTDVAGGDFGVAGSITVSTGGGIGLPNVPLFSATGTVSLMVNTTLHEKTFVIPADFLPLLHPGDPTSITVYASPPGLDGRPVSGASPAVYVKATIQAQLTIGGALTLNGYIGITAAFDTAGTAYFVVDGALGGTIPFLGAVTAAVNLAVYINVLDASKTGIVGRVQLTLGANSIPGISFNVEVLAEINTFAGDRAIKTFAVNTATVNGVTHFGGFVRDGNNNLMVSTTDVTIASGFHLMMYGDLQVLGVLLVHGSVDLTVSSTQISLVVNGTIALSPLGSLNLVDSGFTITSAGLVANLNLRVASSFGAAIGLTFAVNAAMQLQHDGAYGNPRQHLDRPGLPPPLRRLDHLRRLHERQRPGRPVDQPLRVPAHLRPRLRPGRAEVPRRRRCCRGVRRLRSAARRSRHRRRAHLQRRRRGLDRHQHHGSHPDRDRCAHLRA